MQRSGSQKALFVVSIIQIIGAAATIILGVLALVAAGSTGLIDTGSSELNSAVQAGASAVLSIASILAFVAGGWDLLCGFLGIRAANDNQKIMIVWVFTLIALLLDIASVVFCIMDGSFGSNFWTLAFSLTWSALMFWISNNIKYEAGR